MPPSMQAAVVEQFGQPLVLRDVDISSSCSGFQVCTIEHAKFTPVVSDQPQALQRTGSGGDTHAAHAQHVGDELPRHHEFRLAQTIQTEQQPAAQLLVQRMAAVAHSGLRHLGDEVLRVTQQQMQNRPLVQCCKLIGTYKTAPLPLWRRCPSARYLGIAVVCALPLGSLHYFHLFRYF